MKELGQIDIRVYLFAFTVIGAGVGIVVWLVRKIIDEWWKMHREAMQEVSKVVKTTGKIEMTIVKMEGEFAKELVRIEGQTQQNQEQIKVAHARIDKKCGS